MCLQIAFLDRCIVTLVAFVRFFSGVNLYMSPQIACLSGCIVALVAFVWFFSRLSFQMSHQITPLYRCIVALVAFIRFFFRVSFQMSLHTVCPNSCKVTSVAFVCNLPFLLMMSLHSFRRRSIHPGDNSLTAYLNFLIFDVLNFSFHICWEKWQARICWRVMMTSTVNVGEADINEMFNLCWGADLRPPSLKSVSVLLLQILVLPKCTKILTCQFFVFTQSVRKTRQS